MLPSVMGSVASGSFKCEDEAEDRADSGPFVGPVYRACKTNVLEPYIVLNGWT